MNKLKFISDNMAKAGIPYGYGEWKSAITYPYFVGEYIEYPQNYENGLKESEFILTGYDRGTWKDLEDRRSKIEATFTPVVGVSASGKDGAITVCYESAQPLPIDDSGIKRIQITLIIKEWRIYNE